MFSRVLRVEMVDNGQFVMEPMVVLLAKLTHSTTYDQQVLEPDIRDRKVLKSLTPS